MAYLFLKGEMAKKNITIEKISELLGIHRNSVSNKVSGDSSFSIEEARKIRDEYFPTFKVEDLFTKEEG